MTTTNAVTTPRTKSVSKADRVFDANAWSKGKIPESIAPDNLEELFHQLPVEGIWITTHGSLPENYQQFFHSENPLWFSPEIVDYLASEQWLETILPPLKISPLDLEIQPHGKETSYLCMYHPYQSCHRGFEAGTDLWGYWIVWTREPLTPVQKLCIEQQVHCLQVEQTYLQSQSQLFQQVQTLQQALYRTEHQLRTPLSLVELYADFLLQNLPTEALRKQAENISKTVDEIEVSLHRLTRWNGLIQPDQGQCDLKQIIVESVERFQPYLNQKSLQFFCKSDSQWLKIDPRQLKQVFHNLVNNAISFSPEGGTITCQWHVSPTEVVIEISDQGPGFSPGDLANLFTPFYSRRCNGTGLGLVIARDIIEANQGRLWATNRPSGGAVLSIALPGVQGT